jgi:5-methylcytosine-specific restriction endonuclease McrA
MPDTLVINADGVPVSILPLSTISWKEAVLHIYHDKCDILSWYDDWVVRSAHWETKVPAVIMLKSFLRRNSQVRFSKGNIFLRDEYRCLYCETRVNLDSGTLDHVLPQSKGGKTVWENIATACRCCNFKKGNKQLMKPIYAPYKPGYYELVRKRKQLPFRVKHESWAQWIDNGETKLI